MAAGNMASTRHVEEDLGVPSLDMLIAFRTTTVSVLSVGDRFRGFTAGNHRLSNRSYTLVSVLMFARLVWSLFFSSIHVASRYIDRVM